MHDAQIHKECGHQHENTFWQTNHEHVQFRCIFTGVNMYNIDKKSSDRTPKLTIKINFTV